MGKGIYSQRVDTDVTEGPVAIREAISGLSMWLGNDLFLEMPLKSYPEGCLTWSVKSSRSTESTIKISRHSVQLTFPQTLLQNPAGLPASPFCSVVKKQLNPAEIEAVLCVPVPTSQQAAAR